MGIFCLWREWSRFFLPTFVRDKSCNRAKFVEEKAQMTNFVFVEGSYVQRNALTGGHSLI